MKFDQNIIKLQEPDPLTPINDPPMPSPDSTLR